MDRRLSLHRSTLRNLTGTTLTTVQAGANPPQRATYPTESYGDSHCASCYCASHPNCASENGNTCNSCGC